MQQGELKYDEKVIGIPIVLVFSIWFIYWLEIKFNYNFNKFGVYPHTIKGLRGILCSPFIHSDTSHLFNNSIPLGLFSVSIYYFYRKIATKLLILGGLLTGVLTWFIANNSYHIGSSGIVYMLFSFISFSGIFRKHYRLVAISFITILFYGSMIWYVLPVEKGMSWEGHLSGLIAGIFFAYLYRNKGIVKEKYIFEKTEFDDMFDENGNYVPPIIEDSELELNKQENLENTFQGFTINYIYKTNEEE